MFDTEDMIFEAATMHSDDEQDDKRRSNSAAILKSIGRQYIIDYQQRILNDVRGVYPWKLR